MSSFDDEPRAGSGDGRPDAAPAVPSAAAPAIPPALPPAIPPAAPPAVPPPLFPTDRQTIGAAAAPSADPGSMVPNPPGKGGGAKLGAALAVGAAILGAIFVKFGLPLVLVGVAGGVLGSAFGGPYMQLPGDVRSGFEQRLETALGDSFDDLPEDQQSARIIQLISGGMPRLDDGLIAQDFRLTAKALVSVDEATCASLARSNFALSEASDEAANALLGTLAGAELEHWFEIRVAAIEAEVRGSPAQVLISDDDVDAAYQRLSLVMSEADIATMTSLGSGGSVDDAALCAALRGLHNSVLSLSPSDALLLARWFVSP